MAIRTGNQLIYYERGQGKPLDRRCVVKETRNIYDIQYAYVGLIVTTSEGKTYQVTEVDEESFPTKYITIFHTEDAKELIRDLNNSTQKEISSLKEEINNEITNKIGDVSDGYNSSLKDEIDAARADFNKYAQDIADEVREHLLLDLDKANAMIEQTQKDIDAAKIKIDNAATLLNSLQESSGSASVLVDESGGTIDLKTFYANISAQTVTECERIQNAREGEILDAVSHTDVSANTLTEVFSKMNGKLGVIEEKVSTIDPSNGIEKQVGQYLNSKEGQHLISGSVVDVANSAVTAATKDLNAALGRIESEVFSADTKNGTVTSLRQLFELSAKTLSNTVSELEGDGSVKFSDIRQGISSLSALVCRTDADGKLINATGMEVFAPEDGNSKVSIQADKIYLLGETVAEKINTLDLRVNNSASTFFADGSGTLANGKIRWDKDGSGQIGTTGSVISWDSSGNVKTIVTLSEKDKADLLAANSGVTKEQLLDTGINVLSRKISLTGDTFEIWNNIGELNIWVDRDGNLNSRGMQQNLIEHIDTLDKFNNRFIYHDEIPISVEYINTTNSAYKLNDVYISDKEDPFGNYDRLGKGYCLDVLSLPNIVYLDLTNWGSGTEAETIFLPHISSVGSEDTNLNASNVNIPLLYARTYTRSGESDKTKSHLLKFEEFHRMLGKRITIFNRSGKQMNLLIGDLVMSSESMTINIPTNGATNINVNSVTDNAIDGNIYHKIDKYPKDGIAIRPGNFVTIECFSYRSIIGYKGVGDYVFSNNIGWKVIAKSQTTNDGYGIEKNDNVWQPSIHENFWDKELTNNAEINWDD